MSDISDAISALQQTVDKLAPNATEEATKQSLVLPFIARVLGYDVWNPDEVIPEFTADVGIKNGEKVDYVICRNGKPQILIECKKINENLDGDFSQIFRYFNCVEHAHIAILTNGTEYRFFSDIDAPNRMDSKPFMVFDIMKPDKSLYQEIEKLTKSKFDVIGVMQSAERLKYERAVMALINKQLVSPDETFVKYVMGEIYDGSRSRAKVEQFTSIVRDAMSKVVSMRVDERLASALKANASMSQDGAANMSEEDDCLESEELIEQKPRLTVHTTTILDLLSDGALSVEDDVYLMDNKQKTDIKFSPNGTMMIGARSVAPSAAAMFYLPHRKSANGWQHLGVMRDGSLVSLWEIRYRWEVAHGGAQGSYTGEYARNQQISGASNEIDMTHTDNQISPDTTRKRTQHLSVTALLSMGVLSTGMRIKFDGSPELFTLLPNGFVRCSDGAERSISAAATWARHAKGQVNGWSYALVLIDNVWKRLDAVRDAAEKSL